MLSAMPGEQNAERHVLIVDADRRYAKALAEHLARHGYRAAVASPAEMLKELGHFDSGVVLCDIEGADAKDANLPAQLLNARPDLGCIPMATRADRRRAVNRLREGGGDFIDKSRTLDEAVIVIDRCFKKYELQDAAGAGPEVLRRAKQAVEEADRAKFEFLAKISHELRTPLNAIIGFSELIMHDVHGPASNNYRNYVEDIHVSGRHLLDIINDILDFAKAEAGKLLLQESEVDANEVVGALIRLIGPRAREAGLTVNNLLPRDMPHLWCDERKLKQMLLNLLSNAVKFTPSGGRVDIGCSRDESGLTLSVQDTGVGIAKADLARVLQPFVQADNKLSRQQEGTGLGLALVKAMIEIHGGSFKLESEPGKGTTARLTLPPERILAEPVEDESVKRTPVVRTAR
jgi:signal transduction histidine kinase